VRSLAPDAASAKAGEGLVGAHHWPARGIDGNLLWGECRGSGKEPYRARIDTSTVTYKCSCPSRKFPCKHVLGLLLAYAGGAVSNVGAPAWALEWLAEREAKAERQADRATREATPTDDAAKAAAAAKRADTRERRVAGGVAECELWLRDVIRLGLAHAQTSPTTFWETRAARLVDAQCPGLASRVRTLPGIAVSGVGWEERLLAALGEIALLCTAYSRLPSLPAPLQADVRRYIGWSQTQDEIVARGFDVVTDVWTILGVRTLKDDRLTVQRTWLQGSRTGRTALVLNFAAGSAPLGELFAPGSRHRATLVYLESAAPLRAIVAERTTADGDTRLVTKRVDELAATFAEALARDPWFERSAFVIDDVVPAKSADGSWYLRDADGHTLRIARDWQAHHQLLACSGGTSVRISGEWNGRALVPLGAWADDAYVALTT